MSSSTHTSSSRNATTTISVAELKRLETKAKAGWASYYSVLERYHRLSAYNANFQERNREFRQNLNNHNLDMEALDITYLKNQFIEMYDELKKFTECPCCFENLNKENTKLTNCGHLFCITCFDRVDNCPICRKKLYKPRTP